ncbi:MAG: helix-turn-helix domain-containing protein [Armatimonadota bacterium]
MRKDREKMGPEVMSIRELADYLRVSVHTVYRLAEQGKLPGRKVGKHWRFHRDVIVEWLATYREEDALYEASAEGTINDRRRG